jgi:hypothetical protein
MARRIPAVAVLVAGLAGVVVAGSTVDRRGEGDLGVAAPTSTSLPTGEPTPTTVDATDLAPVAPAPDQTGSTWYCAGGTARENGSADHRVVIVNPSDADLRATLTVFGGVLTGGTDPVPEPVAEQLDLPARSRVAVRLLDVLEVQFAAALVEVEGGEVVVEHVVRGARDLDAAPCATAPSTEWHVAAGSTTRDARERLVLFNPFPDDAVVDIDFTTADGLRSPPEFAGFVVPARRVVGVDVGSVVSYHDQVSLSVTARTGRLVVDRIQTFDGTNGPAGLALTPAAPSPARLWYFPDGFRTDGLVETVTVYNPTETQAEVDVELVIDPSPDPAVITAVEPFALSIPPRRFAQVAINGDERVPPGLGHSVVVRSQNDVPVVAERWIRSDEPAPRRGLAATLGSPVVASRWLTAVGGTGEGESEFLVVLNPSLDTIARLSVVTPAGSQTLPIDGLQDIELAPGGRLRVDLGEHVNRDNLPLVVTSSQPVIVERGQYPVVGGIAQSIAVAAAGALVPDVDTGAAPLPTGS